MARSYVRQNVLKRFELQPRSGERSYHLFMARSYIRQNVLKRFEL